MEYDPALVGFLIAMVIRKWWDDHWPAIRDFFRFLFR